MILRQYQETVVSEVLGGQTNDLIQLATGSGKTVIFCSIIEKIIGNTLVLVHRDELLMQTCKMLSSLDVQYQPINAKIKQINHNKTVFVSMVATLSSRLKKNPNYLQNISTIIIDDCGMTKTRA